jgi:mono/diheme cytochrome c family protein
VARGRALAVLGNCQHCHTPRGQAAFSGGRAIPTPFGVVFSSNLTPSAQGLSGWSADDFWRALHHGQSRDGRWLYPAFPINNTTHIDRADSDALHAYLQSLPPSGRPTPPHELDWPYRTQAALKLWRLLYFKPAAHTTEQDPDPTVLDPSDPVRRGAYLVRGLAHCSACHAPRNALGGGPLLALTGGNLPVLHAHAPSLHDPAEAGVQDWSQADVVALFRTGQAGSARATGPMAEVVQHSTQHWPQADLEALAAYLRQLPRHDRPAAPALPAVQTPADAGARLYRQHCADCHGSQGEGRRLADGTWAYTPLAGNRAVTLASPANLVQKVLDGGYPPATEGHPRPFGMPPFVLQLNDAEVAAVLTHIRTAWGNQAPAVSAWQVQALRGASAP